MGRLFSQVGLGIDVLALEVAVVSFVIWVIGLVLGLISVVLNWRSGSRLRKVSVTFGAITLLTAMVLWATCIWVYTRLGSLVQPETLFALTNTCVAAAALLLPTRK